MSLYFNTNDFSQCVAIKHGLSFPFLLHQILAIGALHLAYIHPDRKTYYSTKATEMQSHALEGFSNIQEKIGPSSCGAVMLFSTLLALHVLADKSQTQNLPSSEYLDHLISCFNLMLSVRKVVISEWMPRIAESDLKPLLQFQQPQKPYNTPIECQELQNLPRASDLAPSSLEAYEAAIERLQWMFALADVPATTHSTIRWLLAWPLQLNDDYSKLLNERRPEALIILAYYGVILHFYRESWAVGYSGVLMIRAINSHIGSYWSKWMAWPLQMIGEPP